MADMRRLVPAYSAR